VDVDDTRKLLSLLHRIADSLETIASAIHTPNQGRPTVQVEASKMIRTGILKQATGRRTPREWAEE
jgi:hypothetical protein